MKAPTPDLDQILRRLSAAKQVVYDSETSGLDWRKHKLVGHVLTFSPDPRDSFYVPVRHTGGGNIDKVAAFEKALAKEFKRQSLHVVFHHGAFDMKFMHRGAGIDVGGTVEDTMINAYLLNELQYGFSLDVCCHLAGVQQKKTGIYKYLIDKFNIPEPKHKDAMGWFHELAGDDQNAVDYATGDGTSTWQLNDEQQKGLDLEDLRRVWSTECRLMPVLNRMMIRGIKVDEERLRVVHGIVKQRYNAAMRALPKDFTNDKAPTQLVKLFTDAKIEFPRTAPTTKFPKGQPSFKKDWLKTNPLGRKIITAREYRHLDNSFLGPLIERHLWNGRVHTNYNQTLGQDDYGTKTGRLSANDPNLQQIHKRNEELGRLIRSIFVPDKGMVWGEADYSQIEPRLLAHYSGCRTLLDGFRADPPLDPHLAVARAIFGEQITRDDPERQKGKTINQTLISGGGINKITAELGLSRTEGMKLMADYFRANPEIKTFQRESMGVFESRGYIRSLLGRKARLEDRRFAYVAINRILQLGNADVQKEAIIDCDNYLQSEGDATNLLNNCHDALSFQFPKEDRRDYDRSLGVMSDQAKKFNLEVPLLVDSDEGRNWAVATWGEEEKAA